MHQVQSAQDVLLKGWRSNKDAFNCLNNYFSNIIEEKQVLFQLQQINAVDLTNHNKGIFLRVLEYEYCRRPGIEEEIKDMAYEIISEQAAMNPSVISELRMFNKQDKQLVKDTMRFKMNYRNKKLISFAVWFPGVRIGVEKDPELQCGVWISGRLKHKPGKLKFS